MNRIFVDPAEIQYLRSQIESPSPVVVKRGLQNLCRLYRQGRRIRDLADLIAIEQSVVGLILTRGSDGKIRRWALNALAQFGREEFSREAVIHALNNYSEDPETAASAVAALFSMSRDAQKYIKKKNILDEDLIVLAALQRVSASQIDTSGTSVDIEFASADVLKLALIIVGMDRAPEHLFHPKHPNSEIVNVLGRHHDEIVSQYSVWAITENVNLGVRDLGIDLIEIESQPANVRSWVFQLIAMDEGDARSNLEFIRLGAEDPNPEARRGLTVGLKETYFDGLEDLVMDWFDREHDEDVRRGLVDHLVSQAARCAGYEARAIELYEAEGQESFNRRRMEAMAARTKLWGTFKRISLNQQPDLFGGGFFGGDRGEIMPKNIVNISGDVHGSIVSAGEDVSISGSGNTFYDPETVKKIQAALSEAGRVIHEADIAPELTAEANEAITTAQSDPSPDRLRTAVRFMGKIQTVVSKASEAGNSIIKLISTLQKLGGPID